MALNDILKSFRQQAFDESSLSELAWYLKALSDKDIRILTLLKTEAENQSDSEAILILNKQIIQSLNSENISRGIQSPGFYDRFYLKNTTINVGVQLNYATYDNQNKKIWIQNPASNNIYPVDAITKSVGTPINLGNRPEHVVYYPPNNSLYIAGTDGGLIIVDAETEAVTTYNNISAPNPLNLHYLSGITYIPTLNQMVLTDYYTDPNTDQLIIFDANTPEGPYTYIPILGSKGISKSVFNPNNGLLYVTAFDSSSVLIFDTNNSYSLVTELSLPETQAYDISISVKQNKVYVGHYQTTPLQVSVIDCTTNTILPSIVSSTQGQTVSYIPSIDRIVMSGTTKIEIIDPCKDTITGSITDGFSNAWIYNPELDELWGNGNDGVIRILSYF